MLPFRRELRSAPLVVTSALVLAAGLGVGCAQLIGIEDLPEDDDAGRRDSGTQAPITDAGPDAPPGPPPDADPGCADGELRAVLRVGGTVVTEQPGPYVHALVGDLVEISAEGSCAYDDVLSYEWSISPDDGIMDTALPALAEEPETFSVYSATGGAYTVELTVRGSGGMSVGKTVLAFQAHAWQATAAPSAGPIADLDVGRGNLWIGSVNGLFSLPLAGAPDAIAPVLVNGGSIPTDLQVVLLDDRTSFLWTGRSANTSGALRLDMTATPPTLEQIPFDGENALDDDAQVRDIVAFGTDTVVLATSRGITAVDGSEDFFSGRTQPEGQAPEALAFGTGRLVAGSQRIYNLNDPEGAFDTGVGLGDSKIRTMAIDAANAELWLGTAGLGVVAFDLRDDVPRAAYTDSDSGLGSNRILALQVETEGPYAGDVWAATDKGVSRYIRQRDTWIHMDEDHGLDGHVDVRALAIDTSENRRVIYGGTTAGVIYVRVP
jgi:hypothetical protein